MPELRALWELVRIVFTEHPRTFSDALRFAQIKLLILCGLRVGEVCSIPADWQRVRDYVDLDGRDAGTVGGVSRTLMLRHFAEKQWGRDENSVLLYEAFQHVPTLFEPIIEETLDGIVTLTAPLRERLRLQAETGRHFPEFGEDEYISLFDLYVRLSGNPQIRAAGLPDDLTREYRQSFDVAVLRQIAEQQDRSPGAFAQPFYSYRHLQNTELFRLGIADAMITKRFNRRTVAQSYEYDHRSLAEDLAAIDLPPAARELPEKAQTVAAMIQAGKASGPIVDTFKRIQKEFGDERAFEFLAAEADGFHATPYGHCINSFTIDPCPKHLQCFDGCNHLVATDIKRHRRNLEKTRAAVVRAVDEIKGRRPGIGRDNQLRHAEAMIASIDKVLGTTDGKRPFPDGPDRSAPIGKQRTLFDA